jgi:hypothetical protein
MTQFHNRDFGKFRLEWSENDPDIWEPGCESYTLINKRIGKQVYIRWGDDSKRFKALSRTVQSRAGGGVFRRPAGGALPQP